MQSKYTETIPNLNCDLEFQIELIGEDLLLIITGSQPHLGGVSLAQPYKKPEHPTTSATTSSLGCYSHQDQELTSYCAKTLSKALDRVVVAVGGLHIDFLSKDGLNEVWNCAKKLTQKIINDFKSLR